MRSTTLSALSLAAVFGKTFGFGGIPNQCQSVCNSLGLADDTCDNVFNDDNSERACICNASGAQEAIPLCAACWNSAATAGNNDVDNDDFNDNEAYDLLTSCSLQSLSTYDLANPSTSQTVVAATSPINGTPTITTGPTSTPTPGGSVTTTITTSTSTSTGTDANDLTTSTSSTSTNNAGPTAAPAQFLAGAGILMAAALL